LDHEITSVINRALFRPKALAHIGIMKSKMNAKGAIIAFAQQNATPAMALAYREVITNAAPMVDNGVINIEQN